MTKNMTKLWKYLIICGTVNHPNELTKLFSSWFIISKGDTKFSFVINQMYVKFFHWFQSGCIKRIQSSGCKHPWNRYGTLFLLRDFRWCCTSEFAGDFKVSKCMHQVHDWKLRQSFQVLHLWWWKCFLYTLMAKNWNLYLEF